MSPRRPRLRWTAVPAGFSTPDSPHKRLRAADVAPCYPSRASRGRREQGGLAGVVTYVATMKNAWRQHLDHTAESRWRVVITALIGIAVATSAAVRASSALEAPSREPLLTMTSSFLALEARRPATVHVLHLGDSHLASSPEPAYLGAALHEAFGDGGPGLFMPWTPPRYHIRHGVTTGSSPGWRIHLPQAGGTPVGADLMGCFIEASRPGEVAWAEGEGSVVRLFVVRQPGGGGLELLVDDEVVAREPTAAVTTAPAEIRHVIPGPPRTHRVRIRTTAAGPVRVVGLALEKPGGIAYSPLGILGAQADMVLLGANDETFGLLLRSLKPAAVILAFGTNEAGEAAFDPMAYTRLLVQAIQRIQWATPTTTVFLAAPPDRAAAARQGWRSVPAISLAAEAQHQACRLTGARFIDRLAIMGGPGTVDRWARATPPLARPDRTHFTAEGYARLASIVAAYIINVYNSIKASPELATFLRQRDPEAPTLLALAGRPVSTPAAVTDRLLAIAAAPPASTRPRSGKASPVSSRITVVRDGSGAVTITNYPTTARDPGGDPDVTLGHDPRQLDGLRGRSTGGGGSP